MTPARALTWAGLVIGIAGLVLQFIVSMRLSASVGRSTLASIEFFFAFFTVLTNIAAVLAYAAALSGKPAWFARPRVRAGVAVAITVVCITYATVLAQLWEPEGANWVADTTLHYVAPVLFVVWWALAGRTGGSRLGDIPWWLVYPLLYLVFVLARGTILSIYPYPFLDLTTKSVAQVAQASLMMLALFAVVSAIAVAADRLLPAPNAKP